MTWLCYQACGALASPHVARHRCRPPRSRSRRAPAPAQVLPACFCLGPRPRRCCRWRLRSSVASGSGRAPLAGNRRGALCRDVDHRGRSSVGPKLATAMFRPLGLGFRGSSVVPAGALARGPIPEVPIRCGGSARDFRNRLPAENQRAVSPEQVVSAPSA